MKITQEKAPFRPVTVVFEDLAELKKLVESLRVCANDALVEDHDYSGRVVQQFQEQLKVYIQ